MYIVKSYLGGVTYYAVFRQKGQSEDEEYPYNTKKEAFDHVQLILDDIENGDLEDDYYDSIKVIEVRGNEEKVIKEF